MGTTTFEISESVDGAIHEPSASSRQGKIRNQWLFGLGVGKRHWMTLLLCIGIFNIYTLRICLSIAIVAMVEPTARPAATNSSSTNWTSSLNGTTEPPGTSPLRQDICPAPEGLNAVQAPAQTNSPRFAWDSQVQGTILGSYFYGYIAGQIPGGWLSRRFGGKLPFGLGILIAGILTALSPVAATYHYGALVALRIVEGLATAVCYPAMHHLLARWSPSRERTRMSSLVNCGSTIGNVIVFAVSGFIGDYLGWESIFYVYSGITGLWFVFFQLFVHNTPAEHPSITDAEMILITGSTKRVRRGDARPMVSVPWRRILTALPVWAIFLSHFGHTWGTYTLQTNLPNYMRNILNFQLSANGIFSALPYLAQWVFGLSSAYASDYLRHRNLMSTTNVRKMFNTLANVIPTAALIAVGYVDCDWATAVTLLTIGNGFAGLTQSSFIVNGLDLSLVYASTIFSVSNTFANVPGIVSPYTVGLITAGPDGQTIANWRIIFYLSGGIRMFTAILYAIFASGDVQPWNYPDGEGETVAVNQGK
ncbi:Sialin [Hypsibius exemplaris]|uniref:Sialin n=1 Tax=Hypsibius exemplaris TaxID=2072580 RepID=A0A1W0XB57_HYPEX|nr:Sialin [Hypsibius exemplaris]